VAVCAIEGTNTFPTAVALRLAGALIIVSKIVHLVTRGDVIEGDLFTEQSESRTD
jgi:hypothetical protein